MKDNPYFLWELFTSIIIICAVVIYIVRDIRIKKRNGKSS